MNPILQKALINKLNDLKNQDFSIENKVDCLKDVTNLRENSKIINVS